MQTPLFITCSPSVTVSSIHCEAVFRDRDTSAKHACTPAEGCTTKQVLQSQAFLVWAGSTKAKAPDRDNRSHDGGYQLALLSSAFFLRICAHSHKRGCAVHYVTLVPHKMDRLCCPPTAYKEYEKHIKEKSNTFYVNNTREKRLVKITILTNCYINISVVYLSGIYICAKQVQPLPPLLTC